MMSISLSFEKENKDWKSNQIEGRFSIEKYVTAKSKQDRETSFKP